MQTKICSKCKINKPYSEYFKDSQRTVGIRCKCKACCKKETVEWREKNRSKYNNYAAEWRAKNPERQHATEIKRNYGLLPSDYEALLVKQEYRCKICRKLHNPSLKRGRLYVDHCHATGKVRGLLCSACNSAIGYFEDDVVLLQKAIAYLEKNK
jgi:Autographiviridae endonuclease VII